MTLKADAAPKVGNERGESPLVEDPIHPCASTSGSCRDENDALAINHSEDLVGPASSLGVDDTNSLDDSEEDEIVPYCQSSASNSVVPSSQKSIASTEFGHNFRISVCATQGGRKYMEDRVHIEVVRDLSGAIAYTFLGVFDGHGGMEAAEYARIHLFKNIKNHPGFVEGADDASILEAIRAGFLETHEKMQRASESWPRTASGYPSTAGTTASCAIIRNGKIYTGHVGDSAITLSHREGAERHMRLTEDHKPECPREKERIQQSGGAVGLKQFVHRVVWTRPCRGYSGPVRSSTPMESIPFLAVARSLGDFWSYCEETEEFAVSPCPDVGCVPIGADHAGIVLASDGLTNVLTSTMLSALVHHIDEKPVVHKQNTKSDHPSTFGPLFVNHARVVMRRTLQKWTRFRADNVSAVVVLFDDVVSNPDLQLLKDDEDVAEERLEHDDSLEEVFRANPDTMVIVQDKGAYRVRTLHCPLEYNGVFDNNFQCMTGIGPGYMSHEEEERRDGERMAAEDGMDPEELAQLERYYDSLGRGDSKENTPDDGRVAPSIISTRPLISTSQRRHVKKITLPNCSRRKRRALKSAEQRTAASVEALKRAITPPRAGTPEKRNKSEEEKEVEEGRPVTPENSEATTITVLRSARSSTKPKSRLALAHASGKDIIKNDNGSTGVIKFCCNDHGLSCSKAKNYNELNRANPVPAESAFSHSELPLPEGYSELCYFSHEQTPEAFCTRNRDGDEAGKMERHEEEEEIYKALITVHSGKNGIVLPVESELDEEGREVEDEEDEEMFASPCTPPPCSTADAAVLERGTRSALPPRSTSQRTPSPQALRRSSRRLLMSEAPARAAAGKEDSSNRRNRFGKTPVRSSGGVFSVRLLDFDDSSSGGGSAPGSSRKRPRATSPLLGMEAETLETPPDEEAARSPSTGTTPLLARMAVNNPTSAKMGTPQKSSRRSSSSSVTSQPVRQSIAARWLGLDPGLESVTSPIACSGEVSTTPVKLANSRGAPIPCTEDPPQEHLTTTRSTVTFDHRPTPPLPTRARRGPVLDVLGSCDDDDPLEVDEDPAPPPPKRYRLWTMIRRFLGGN